MLHALRLGADVFEGKFIKSGTVEKAIKAIKTLLVFAHSHNAIQIRAVATSAMREAHNQKDLLKQIKDQTGLSVEVISGMEEGRLIYLAVSTVVDLTKGLSVLLDIGGGSVEVSLVQDNDILVSESIELGADRVVGRSLSEGGVFKL